MIWPNYLSINDKQVCQWLTNFLVSSINDKQVCQWFDPIEWSPTTTSKLASEQWCAMMCQWFDPIICPSAAACGLLLQIQQATSCKCNGYYYHYHHAISLLLLWSMIWLLSSSTSTSLLTIKNTRIATATTLLTAYCQLPTSTVHSNASRIDIAITTSSHSFCFDLVPQLLLPLPQLLQQSQLVLPLAACYQLPKLLLPPQLLLTWTQLLLLEDDSWIVPPQLLLLAVVAATPCSS